MNLLPLAQRLEDAGIGIQGESVFINSIPAECPQGVLLRNKLQGTLIDHELPGYYKTSFQLIVRSTSYVGGEELIGQVFDALTVERPAQIGPMLFKFMRPKSLPAVFPLSKGNLLEFAADFEVAFTQ
jgi:hypothetical protein